MNKEDSDDDEEWYVIVVFVFVYEVYYIYSIFTHDKMLYAILPLAVRQRQLPTDAPTAPSVPGLASATCPAGTQPKAVVCCLPSPSGLYSLGGASTCSICSIGTTSSGDASSCFNRIPLGIENSYSWTGFGFSTFICVWKNCTCLHLNDILVSRHVCVLSMPRFLCFIHF